MGISNIIETYYIGRFKLRIAAEIARSSGEASADSMSVETFEEEYPEPYDSINRTLRDIGAWHEVKRRGEHEWIQWYESGADAHPPIVLKNKRTGGQDLTFDHLSTGEQTIVWLASLRYRIQQTNIGEGEFLVLLDELDAGLHPALIRKFTGILKLLGESGATVILATHSPITVGLSDDDWIHSMFASQDRTEIVKTDRETAIQDMLGWTRPGTQWTGWRDETEVTEAERQGWSLIAKICKQMGDGISFFKR